MKAKTIMILLFLLVYVGLIFYCAKLAAEEKQPYWETYEELYP